METKDYQAQADGFLKKHGITFKAIFKGDKCPPWDDEKHIHGDRYLIVLKRQGRQYSTSFWNSLNDSQKGKTPTAYDFLSCMEKNDPYSFEDFCGEFGYDTDSRKALKTFEAVEREWKKVTRFFSQEEIEELSEIQ